MRAKSMRQVQMRRASRAVRHIEEPQLLDVNRTTWKRFHQANVALPLSQWRSARAARARALRCTTGSMAIIISPSAPRSPQRPAVFKSERNACMTQIRRLASAKSSRF